MRNMDFSRFEDASTGLADNLTNLKHIIVQYEDVCAALSENVEAKHVASINHLYDCLSLILVRMTQDTEAAKLQVLFAHGRYAHTNRLLSVLTQMNSALPQDMIQNLFLAPGTSVNYNALEVAMTMRRYTQCVKELVTRKLKEYMDQDARARSSSSFKEGDIVTIDSKDAEGNQVRNYYVRINGGQLLRVDPSSYKKTSAAKTDDGDM